MASASTISKKEFTGRALAGVELKQSPRRQKRRKTEGSDGTLTLEELQTLGSQLLSSRAHLNNLPVVLRHLSPSSRPEIAVEALVSLQSFFTPLVSEIFASRTVLPDSGAGEEDAELVFKAWLRTRFDEFLSSLIDFTVSSEPSEALRELALDAILDFVKLGEGGRFYPEIYHQLLSRIVHAASPSDSLIELLASKYFKYIDVGYFTFINIEKIARSCERTEMHDTKQVATDGEDTSETRTDASIRSIFRVLSHIPAAALFDTESSYDMWSEQGISAKKRKKKPSKVLASEEQTEKSKERGNANSANYIQKKLKLRFKKAWLSFLMLPLPLDVYKEVLPMLHRNVIPYMRNPSLLCDFLTTSYDIGGVVSVMALSGLFILMTQYGLEYPKFYEKLYTLLTPAIFMAKHRAVFFQLMDTCLKSSYLPAYLAASFAKKLSRLALTVPPSGAIIIIALIHNLLRRHPSINFLINLAADDSIGGIPVEKNELGGYSCAANGTKGVDLFRSEEMDPAKSDAMRSSLWEIDTLRHHYCPAVSRFVASLENDLTVRSKTTEIQVADFSSGSYATIFRSEVRRRIKQVPLAFYRSEPTSLFFGLDFAGWTFDGSLCDGMQEQTEDQQDGSG